MKLSRTHRAPSVAAAVLVLLATVTTWAVLGHRGGGAREAAAPTQSATPRPTADATSPAVGIPPAPASASAATAVAASSPAPTTASPASPCGRSLAPPARYQHVIWVWMENKSFGGVIGSGQAPYISSLANACAADPNWHDAGTQFDSEPNYMAMTTGLPASALGQFQCDCASSPTVSTTADNLFRQVRAAGGTERSYQEGMPGNCASGGGAGYAPKHNPAAYMWGAGDRPACQADDVPMGSSGAGALVSDLRNDTLPAFTAVTPDLCHDMHDCGVASGDAFLEALVPQILSSRAYTSGNTAVAIVWDEDTPIPNVVIAPSVHPGSRPSTPVSHYGLLRATEEMLGLPLLGEAGSAVSLRPVFNM